MPRNDQEFRDTQSRIRATFILREVTLIFFFFAVIFFKATNLLFYSVRVNYVLLAIAIWLISSFIFRFLANKQTTANAAGNLYFGYDLFIELPILTIIIYNIGVTEWIGPVFLLFPIVYTSIVFQRKKALLIATSASFYYASLLALQYFGTIPSNYFYFTRMNSQEIRNYFIDTILFMAASFYLISLAANLFTGLLTKKTIELEDTKGKLEDERASLEIKVRARTRELEDTAKSLEQKVQERTKEIQNKMTELEKFNKVAIGREMKMIELKKKLQEMEEEIKNKK